MVSIRDETLQSSTRVKSTLTDFRIDWIFLSEIPRLPSSISQRILVFIPVSRARLSRLSRCWVRIHLTRHPRKLFFAESKSNPSCIRNRNFQMSLQPWKLSKRGLKIKLEKETYKENKDQCIVYETNFLCRHQFTSDNCSGWRNRYRTKILRNS